MHHSLTNQQLEKLGNTLVYLAHRVSDFSKTKALKLLYILEESSIKKFGYPFFGFNFQLWKFGPVLKDVYIDLSEEEPSLLKQYIKKEGTGYKPIATFVDDEFSDNDIYLMDKVIDFAQGKNAKQLVDYTNGPNSLWRKSAIQHGVLEHLENQNINSTDINIDFTLLFEDDEAGKERYESALENLSFMNHLKNPG